MSCVTREGVTGNFCPNFRLAKELRAQTRGSADSTTLALAERTGRSGSFVREGTDESSWFMVGELGRIETRGLVAQDSAFGQSSARKTE